MAVDIHINFNGNCREAVEFYASVFGTETPQIMTWGDKPPSPNFSMPEAAKKLVMHTRLNINGSNVMFADVPPGMPFIAGNNISLVIVVKNEEEIRSLFGKLKEGGSVQMALQQMFFAKLYAYLVDRFGIGWQLLYNVVQTGM